VAFGSDSVGFSELKMVFVGVLGENAKLGEGHGLELTARRHAGSRVFCGQLQTVTEDIFILAVLVCSAH